MMDKAPEYLYPIEKKQLPVEYELEQTYMILIT
jgi:hypothetical protein